MTTHTSNIKIPRSLADPKFRYVSLNCSTLAKSRIDAKAADLGMRKLDALRAAGYLLSMASPQEVEDAADVSQDEELELQELHGNTAVSAAWPHFCPPRPLRDWLTSLGERHNMNRKEAVGAASVLLMAADKHQIRRALRRARARENQTTPDAAGPARRREAG